MEARERKANMMRARASRLNAVRTETKGGRRVEGNGPTDGSGDGQSQTTGQAVERVKAFATNSPTRPFFHSFSVPPHLCGKVEHGHK